MADLIDVITNSVEEVSSGSDSTGDVESGGAGTGGTGSDVASAGSSTAEAAGTAEGSTAHPATGSTTPDTDELDRELEAQGIKRVSERGENRIPYSRVKKIVENARKKLADAHTLTLTETTGRLTKAEERAKVADTVDQLITGDPDRYIGMLAMLHPDKYRKFVTPQQASAGPAVPKEDTDPKPQPDWKFEDGSLGFTAQQHEKLLEWNARQATQAALAALEKQYGTTLNRVKEREAQQEQYARAAPKVATQLNWAKAKFGKLFEEDYNRADEGKSEILTYMQAHPEIPFEAAVMEVLDPKRLATLQTDRNKLREELLAEINKRPGAAATSTAGSTKAPAAEAGPRTMEDVIRESIAALR